ncbi:MAG: hypothetical protein QM497_08970 [Sulfurimonas sp.]
MKTILLIILTLSITTNIFASTELKNEERMCEIFQNKVLSYKKIMDNDEYAKKTLESYENRADLFCLK